MGDPRAHWNTCESTDTTVCLNPKWHYFIIRKTRRIDHISHETIWQEQWFCMIFLGFQTCFPQPRLPTSSPSPHLASQPPEPPPHGRSIAAVTTSCPGTWCHAGDRCDTPVCDLADLPKAPVIIYGNHVVYNKKRTQGHNDFLWKFLVYRLYYNLIWIGPIWPTYIVNARMRICQFSLITLSSLTLSCYEEDRTGWDMNRHPVFVKQMGLTVQKRP